ncbi:clumping factor B-like [Frankliniella occidentalis]|uniref:Clumping factor B-like n=1 Tax=Frankliniella occidentalis TaxID=133901 RepID=A0A9C6X291_FRAOC|nr:clumping factor B-like [Frankliniella occidentalis]
MARNSSITNQEVASNHYNKSASKKTVSFKPKQSVQMKYGDKWKPRTVISKNATPISYTVESEGRQYVRTSRHIRRTKDLENKEKAKATVCTVYDLEEALAKTRVQIPIQDNPPDSDSRSDEDSSSTSDEDSDSNSDGNRNLIHITDMLSSLSDAEYSASSSHENLNENISENSAASFFEDENNSTEEVFYDSTDDESSELYETPYSSSSEDDEEEIPKQTLRQSSRIMKKKKYFCDNSYCEYAM